MNLANDVSKCNKAAGVFNGPLWKYIKPPFFNLFSAKDTGHHQLASWRRAVSFLLVIFLLLKTTSSTKNWKKKKIEKKRKRKSFLLKKTLLTSTCVLLLYKLLCVTTTHQPPWRELQTRKPDIIHSSGGNDRKSNSLTLTEIIILCYYSVRVCAMERVVQLGGVVKITAKRISP